MTRLEDFKPGDDALRGSTLLLAISYPTGGLVAVIGTPAGHIGTLRIERGAGLNQGHHKRLLELLEPPMKLPCKLKGDELCLPIHERLTVDPPNMLHDFGRYDCARMDRVRFQRVRLGCADLSYYELVVGFSSYAKVWLVAEVFHWQPVRHRLLGIVGYDRAAEIPVVGRPFASEYWTE